MLSFAEQKGLKNLKLNIFAEGLSIVVAKRNVERVILKRVRLVDD